MSIFQFYCLFNNTFYDISPSSKDFSLMSHITFSCSISLVLLNLEHFNNISLYGIANFKEYSLCTYCFFFSTESSSFYTFFSWFPCGHAFFARIRRPQVQPASKGTWCSSVPQGGRSFGLSNRGAAQFLHFIRTALRVGLALASVIRCNLY